MSSSPSQPIRIDALTGLRFYAALHIVFFHEGLWMFQRMADATTGWLHVLAGGALELVRNGPASVMFFFVLSGFILFHTYHSGIESGTFARRRFWVARVARIFPVYFLGLALTAPLVFVACRSGITSWADAARSGVLGALLLQAWHVPDALSWNGPGWSLSVETFFYLSFPFIAPWIARVSAKTAVIAAIVLHLATRISMFVLAGSAAFSAQEWMDISAYFPPCRLAEFVLGLAVGRVFVATRNSPVLISKGDAVALLVLSVLTLTGIAKPLGVTGGLILQPIAFAFAIYAVARTGAGGAWTAGRTAILLGEASYAMYLLHVPIARYVAVLTRKTIESGALGVAGFFGYLVAVIAISLAAFRWLECPARNWIRAKLSR